MTNLLDVFQRKGYLTVPSQSERSQTSIAATWQHEDAFPPAEHQHLGWLAEILACESWADQDNKGWNIMHHLFHAVRSSTLAADIVANLANRCKKCSNGLGIGTKCGLQCSKELQEMTHMVLHPSTSFARIATTATGR